MAQGRDSILNKDISSHQGSSSSSKEVRAEMNTKVRGEPNHSKNKCCSSWGITRGYYNSMNRNYLTWKLSSPIPRCFKRMLLTGPYDVHKFMTLSPKDYYLIPGNGANKLVDRIRVCSQVHNTITKGLWSNPRKNCAIKLVDHFYELIWIKTPIQIYDLLPKDYYLILSNKTIKLECGFL